MTTPEQQALQLAAQAWCTPATSSLEMDVNLATAVAEKFAPIIAENAALKAELAAIKGAGEPVAWAVKTNGRYNNMFLGNEQTAVERMCRLNFNFPGDKRAVVPLYTRPCVPLTDEQRAGLLSAWRVAPKDEADFLKGITAAEAAHNIKGAKP